MKSTMCNVSKQWVKMFLPILQNRTDLVGWTLTESNDDSTYHTVAVLLGAGEGGVIAMIDPDSELSKMVGAEMCIRCKSDSNKFIRACKSLCVVNSVTGEKTKIKI